MTLLWLIRHGQTDWNLEERYQGQTDTPLNPAGLGQARRLADYLVCQGVSFQAIYSSDLRRAAQTAEMLGSRLKLPVRLDVRLREINLGVWEGNTVQQVLEMRGEGLRRGDFPPGGETPHEVALRMHQAADDYARLFPGGDILVVSHGYALSVLTCLAEGTPVEHAYQVELGNAHLKPISWKV